MRDVVLITGASSGIGLELARLFAAGGHDLALTARRAERLDALADEVAAAGRPRPLVLPLDLAAPGAEDEVAGRLDAAGARARVLVNNAGYGLLGDVEALDPARQVGIVDLNVRALTALTLRLLPGIIAARGGLLNVASIAGFIAGGPNMAVYYASKAYVLSLSEALSAELKPFGVTVTALCPGPVATEFAERAGMAPLMTPAVTMSAADVARAGYEGFLAGRRVVVPGAGAKLMRLTAPLTPRALLLPLLERFQKVRGAEP